MEYKIEYSISVEEFLEMVEAVGWKTYSTEQVKKALKNTMYMVKISYNNEIVGMGRVVGDYRIVCMLTDICVKPKAQRKGIDSYVSISPKMKSLNVGKDIEKSKTVCRIFGILLDNAIDAATESDEKRISLEMYRLDQKLIFVVMNTFKGDFNVAKIQEKGYTTKGKGHGNGLNYVRNIIARDNRYTLQTSLIGGYYTQKVTIEE